MIEKKILVIDDEPDIITMIETVFKTKRYIVISANNGAEGLEKVRTEKPDLILLDLMMPVLSGLEVCKKLRSDDEYKDIPILVMSALGSRSDKSDEFWKAGLKSDDFIAKPFDPLALLGRVEYLLRKKEYVSNKHKEPTETAEKPYPEKPENVVKAFIESWNTEDFATEFTTLSSEMTGNLSLKEYIARRKQCYIDTNGRERKQYLEQVITVDADNYNATVACKRSDEYRGHKKYKKEIYKLKRIKNRWVISTVTSKPL